LAKLLAVASPEIGWAAQLAKHTGLRQGDLLRLAWSNVSDTHIEIATGKSRNRRAALIPMHSALRELLRAIPKRASLVLTNSRGLPWRGFGSSWNKAMKDAGLDSHDLHFHDFRGTFATVVYGKLETKEIAQTLGWSEQRVERIIERYVNRETILRDRIARMDSR
jgi:integrase